MIFLFKFNNFGVINKYVTILFITVQTQTKFLVFSAKLIEYNFSALSVFSNPYNGPFPRTRTSFFLLSVFVDELTSTQKVITFLPTSLPNEKLPRLSNPVP